MAETSENPGGAEDRKAAQPAEQLSGTFQPRPRHPPPPTCWPFVTAVGIMGCFWGLLLMPLVIIVAGAILVIGLAGLIGDWVREHRTEST